MFVLNTLIKYFKNPKISDYTAGSTHKIKSEVAVCISGGGSRSLTAGMGQLRGLRHLQVNGKTLLAQTKALSVVSGGSWVGLTYTYLPSNFSETDFLGDYKSPDQYNMQNISMLHQDCIGKRVVNNFSPEDLVFQSILLMSQGTPKNKIWYHLISNHILKHYNLNKANSFFTLDHSSLKRAIKNNKQLSPSMAYLVNQNSPRPFLICNASMFIRQKGSSKQSKSYCAPIQITPSFVGSHMHNSEFITAQSLELIDNSAIDSCAFDSQPVELFSDKAKVKIKNLFSLADAQCCTSAFFAGVIENLGKEFFNDKLKFKGIMKSKASQLSDFHKSLLPENSRLFLPEIFSEAERILQKGEEKIMGFLEKAKVFINHSEDIALQFVGKLKDLIPQYKYWSPRRKTTAKVRPNKFADGAVLDNSGIPALLVYEDISKIIAFVNTETPMQRTSHGIVDSFGRQITGTNILIDEWIPALFGYQPYVENKGYIPFSSISNSKYFSYKYNQVFRQNGFQKLLKGLWAAANQTENKKSAANFKQNLTTVKNNIHAVRAGRKIEVLWSYLSIDSDWQNQLEPTIKKDVLSPLLKQHNFPYYAIFNTNLSSEQVNLLASLTSWNIVEANSALFKSIYAEH